jgi:hypothetical protein
MNRRLTRIDELARDIPPVRDLWPAIEKGIAAAIEAGRATGAPPQPKAGRRSFWMPAAGLAASVLLVAVGVFIGQRIGTQPGRDRTIAGNPVETAVIPAAYQRDAEYRKQRNDLLLEVQEKLKTMPPAERAKVSASLDTLRKSIAEIETALGHDPANALLQELLVSSCQEEMRALTAVRDSGREEI